MTKRRSADSLLIIINFKKTYKVSYHTLNYRVGESRDMPILWL